MVDSNINNLNVIFFYPSKNIGGVQSLFARLGKALSMSCKVFYVEENFGVYRKLGVERYANILNFDEAFDIGSVDTTVVVSPVSELIKLKNYFPSEVRLLVWSLHPYNAISFFPGFNYFSRLEKNTIKKIIKSIFKVSYNEVRDFLLEANIKNGLVFMDGENSETNIFFYDIHLSHIAYIPVPVDAASCESKSKPFPIRKIGWLGRVEHFKTSILDYTIARFIDSAVNDNDIIFLIIGKGQDLLFLQNKYQGNKNVEFIGELEFEKLNSFLVSEVDLAFSMGTAALESAKLGIPTVLLDAFYGAVPKSYKFNWLYQTNNFTLGRVFSGLALKACNGFSFNDIVRSVSTDYEKHAHMSKKYVTDNHEVGSVSDILYNQVVKTNLFIKNIPDFERGFLFKVIKKISSSKLTRAILSLRKGRSH